MRSRKLVPGERDHARRASPRASARDFRRRLRFLPALDRALESADGAESGLCALAGGRGAVSGDSQGAFRSRLPAHPSRRRGPRRSGSRRRSGRTRGRQRALARSLSPHARRRSAGRAGVPAHRGPPVRRDGGHASALGTVRSEADVRRRDRPVPAPARPLLSRGLRLALGPGRRARRRERSAADRPVPGLGAVTDGDAGRYWLLPTLSWISSSDTALHLQCAAGTGAALLLLAGLAPAWSAAAAWLLYLSLSVAGQTFLEFQWDFLLTETGLLAIFLAPPLRLRLRAGLSSPPARAVSPRLAALPPDALVGRREAPERRRRLAQPHGPPRPLRDAAAAAVDRVVRAPAPGRPSRRSRASFCSSSSSRCRFSSSPRGACASSPAG